MKAWHLGAAMAVALLLMAGAGRVEAQFGATQPQFRVEWQEGKSKKGAPILDGYVFNTRPTGAIDVRLLVEILDAQGQVIGRTYGVVQGSVNAFDRVYFYVPLPMTGASYRVSVYSFELRGGGGAGM
ncbi:MAG TPA: hypothetical protein VGT00_02710 [Methylomirabilota bacterium]|jgi:hypothetical protein|nr:hypothetical protein [Methylomirabilota bacterium]